MLRETIITEWQTLKEIISSNQQHQWGSLLARLGIKSLAPRLDLELVTEEISQRIKKTDEQTREVFELNERLRILSNREFQWREAFRKLKEKANIQEGREIKLYPYTDDLVTNLEQKLEASEAEMKWWKGNFDFLKEMIYFFEPHFDEDDDESGPTIEEVD